VASLVRLYEECRRYSGNSFEITAVHYPEGLILLKAKYQQRNGWGEGTHRTAFLETTSPQRKISIVRRWLEAISHYLQSYGSTFRPT
jgi:hypothetical protein